MTFDLLTFVKVIFVISVVLNVLLYFYKKSVIISSGKTLKEGLSILDENVKLLSKLERQIRWYGMTSMFSEQKESQKLHLEIKESSIYLALKMDSLSDTRNDNIKSHKRDGYFIIINMILTVGLYHFF